MSDIIIDDERQKIQKLTMKELKDCFIIFCKMNINFSNLFTKKNEFIYTQEGTRSYSYEKEKLALDNIKEAKSRLERVLERMELIQEKIKTRVY